MEKPFEHIALSLSGGGVRAAAFGLGALKLLAEANLLKNVHMLSTISGGTITGSYYAVNAKKKKTFAEIYSELYDILEKDKIVDIALNVLEEQGVEVPSGRQNLILSFAEAYDRELFHKEKFGIFREGENANCVDEKDFHLKEIIFNATDFESGIAFRFRKSIGSSRIGNRYNHITREQAKNVRMADILAASACFPGGFEPIGIPDDFKWGNPAIYRSVKKTLKGVNVPLMDGGVYDNQGCDSLLMANKNNQKYLEDHPDEPDKTKHRQVSTLFIMVDVAGAERNFFEMPVPEQSRRSEQSLEDKYSRVKSRIETCFKIKPFILPVIGILTLAMAGFGFWSLVDKAMPWGLIFCFAPLTVIFAVLFLSVKTVLKKVDGLKDKFETKVQPEIKKLEKKFPDIFPEATEAAGKLSLNRIIDMLEIRAKSVFAMTGGIFMKRIRSHGFSELFSDKKLEKKRVASIITDLTKKDTASVPAFLKSGHLRKIARHAAEMATTLWFKTDKHRLRSLVASGRFTLCFNLLKYTRDLRKDSPLSADAAEVEKGLKRIWKKIKKDPYYNMEK